MLAQPTAQLAPCTSACSALRQPLPPKVPRAARPHTTPSPESQSVPRAQFPPADRDPDENRSNPKRVAIRASVERERRSEERRVGKEVKRVDFYVSLEELVLIINDILRLY